MSTVAQVVDRVYRDWLHSPDDQPVNTVLVGSVSAVATEWPYDASVLGPEEEELLAPGVIVECGLEQARITDVNVTTSTLTVTREVNGTVAASHADGDELRIAPTYGRHAVTEAVKDNVVDLYPDLWYVDTATLSTNSEAFVEVPAEVITGISFLYLRGARYLDGVADLLVNFPPSTTGKAIQTTGVPAGSTAYYTYRSKFTRPTAESDDLTADFGVAEEWERIVAVGAASQVVASRDLDALSAEYIVEQLEREALPADSPQRIRNGLLTLRNIWVEQARRRLTAEHSTPVNYNVVRRG